MVFDVDRPGLGVAREAARILVEMLFSAVPLTLVLSPPPAVL